MYLINTGMSKGDEVTDGHPHVGLHGIRRGDAIIKLFTFRETKLNLCHMQRCWTEDTGDHSELPPPVLESSL